MNRLFTPLCIALLTASAAPAAFAQVQVSDYTNSGDVVTDFGNAETVTTDGSTGIGYRSGNGGVFNHQGPATGTLTVNGNYDAFTLTPLTPGVDNFTGFNNLQNTAAEIAGNTAPLFGILNLNNGAANAVSITNTAGADVGSAVAFSNGLTNTVRASAGTGALRFRAGSAYSNTALGDAQYVNGYVTKIGATAFTFPVGNQSGTDLRTLSISGLGSSATISVAYWQGDVSTALDPTGGAHPRTALGPGLQSVSSIGFWDLVPTGSPATSVQITVSLPAQSGAGSYTIASDIRLVGWNTTTNQWEALGAAGASGLGEGATLSGTASNITQYSAIGFGSSNQVALPITLVSFDAVATGCEVNVEWRVAEESKATGYDVERSPDAVRWQTIAQIAARNSGATTYNWNDKQPLPGISYYRMQMAEQNGKTSYSAVVKVNSECDQSGGLVVTPNPAPSMVRVSGLRSAAVLTLSSSTGALVREVRATSSECTVDVATLAPGIYTLRIAQEGEDLVYRQITHQ